MGSAYGQVKGVSYTITPSASYNWFGEDSGLDDAFMFGGRVGFGFGEYVELRATYMQTIDLETDFAGLGLDSTFSNKGVDLRRYGAELKLNIGRGSLLPYLLIGGGIQDQDADGVGTSDNIFGTVGLGLTLTAADRYSFGVEGKYIAYSGNAIRNLVDSIDQNDPGIDILGSDNIGTFAVAANLSIYLGGRRPGQLSDIDEEYMRTFQGGLSGLSIPFELGGMRMDWDDDLPYRDAYFAGATAGFNFGPLISLRGFYYRGMKDDEISFDFDDIAMYGADFRFNLTQASSGLVPYLNVGGGYIDLSDGYNDNITDESQFASSQGFASGGGGLYIKFGDRVRLNGGVKAVLTTGADLEDLNSRDQITTSYMYNAGLGFTLGGRTSTPDAVRRSTLEDRLAEQDREFERRADSIRNANQQEIANLRERYQDSIAQLDREIALALEDGDVDDARAIQQDRDQAVAIVRELDDRNRQIEAEKDQAERAEIDAALGRPTQTIVTAPGVRPATPSTPTGSVLYLESQQIDRLIDAIGNRNAGNSSNQDMQQSGGGQGNMQDGRINQLERRLDRMEDMMFRMNDNESFERRNYDYDRAPRSDDERVRRLEERLDQLRDQNNELRNDDDYDNGLGADQRRIRELEDQLQQRRRNARDNNDDDEDRLREMERRMTERINDLRDNRYDDETEEVRRTMIAEMAEYQSEMMDEIRNLQEELRDANEKLTRSEADEERLALERDRLRAERRALRRANSATTTTDSLGNVVTTVPGTRDLEDLQVNTGGVYLADGNEEGFFSNFTYTGMSGTAGFNFGDATGLGLGLRWHYKLGPAQRAEFMPEAYFGIGSPTTFGIFGNIIYPLITERSQSTGLIPYAGLGIGAMQIQDQDNEDEINFRPAINLLIGTYLPVGNGRVFADFSTRNFFSVNQLTGGYRFNF